MASPPLSESLAVSLMAAPNAEDAEDIKMARLPSIKGVMHAKSKK